MSCNCCVPTANRWLLAVDELPSIIDADENHAYILPNNKVYVLSHDRSKMILLGGAEGKGVARIRKASKWIGQNRLGRRE